MRIAALVALTAVFAIGSATPAIAGIGGNQVESDSEEGVARITTSVTTPGGDGSESRSRSTVETTGNVSAWTPPPGIPPWVVPVERCVASADGGYAMDCTGARPAAPTASAESAPGTPGTPGITIRDVATFRPELALLNSEPNGWAVRGLAANFLAAGGSSTRSGTLLGAQAEVRFTPIAWQFDYGDGTAPRSTATPGATWQALGLDEFDETATSHVYETSGSFTVSLLVDYAAEYRLGGAGPYSPIPGTLAILSAPIQLVVADSATTALVDRNCNENPRGPGC